MIPSSVETGRHRLIHYQMFMRNTCRDYHPILLISALYIPSPCRDMLFVIVCILVIYVNWL